MLRVAGMWSYLLLLELCISSIDTRQSLRVPSEFVVTSICVDDSSAVI